MLWDLAQFHYAGVGQVIRSLKARDLRNGRARAGVDKDPIAFQVFSVDINPVRRGKASMPSVQPNALGTFTESALLPCAPIMHVSILARQHLAKIDLHTGCMDAPFCALAHIMSHLR